MGAKTKTMGKESNTANFLVRMLPSKPESYVAAFQDSVRYCTPY